jgi:tetratricopeptide (TPR) repeat protein
LNTVTGNLEPITEKDYIESIQDICLNERVPEKIKSLFEPALALYAYGYLYWAFFTLANEQAIKAFESAISYKHEEVIGTNVDSSRRDVGLSKKINNLVKRRVIDRSRKDYYHALRMFRKICPSTLMNNIYWDITMKH